jgi:hypothetical protein
MDRADVMFPREGPLRNQSIPCPIHNHCVICSFQSGVVCVPAMPGAIQFYDVTREQHVADLAVSPHGYTSRAQVW